MNECDFCGGQPVVQEYCCSDFPVAALHQHGRIRDGRFTIGVWSACRPCMLLIHAKDQRALTQRAVESQINSAMNPKEQQALWNLLEPVHQAFFELCFPPGES